MPSYLLIIRIIRVGTKAGFWFGWMLIINQILCCIVAARQARHQTTDHTRPSSSPPSGSRLREVQIFVSDIFINKCWVCRNISCLAQIVSLQFSWRHNSHLIMFLHYYRSPRSENKLDWTENEWEEEQQMSGPSFYSLEEGMLTVELQHWFYPSCHLTNKINQAGLRTIQCQDLSSRDQPGQFSL